MMDVRRLVLAVFACMALWPLTSAVAQERDPTAAPPMAAASGAAGAAASPLAQGSSVVVRNGQPHLVVGTRLVAVGQPVGNGKLERITETEIWLREAGQLKKIPRFAGIQRDSVAAGHCASGKAMPRKGTATSPQTAPCAGTQP